MHTRLLGMFEKLDDKWHRVQMDNMFFSVRLALSAMDEKILVAN